MWIIVCLFVDDDGNDGLFYTSQDLEYIYFVHSLCLLGRVLLYSGGRALFPVLLPEREGRFTCRRINVLYIPAKFFFTELWFYQLGYIFVDDLDWIG